MFFDYETYPIKLPKEGPTPDLKPITSGFLKAKSNYVCKPRILDDYYLIYVQKGLGIFKINNITHRIQKGNLLILFPGVLHAYRTDPENLLELIWVGFNGTEAKGLIKNTEISLTMPFCHTGCHSKTTEQLLSKLLFHASNQKNGSFSIIKGCLYQLFGTLAVEDETVNILPNILPGDHPIERALSYIEAHFTEPLTIADLADHVALSRSHFTTRFKKEVGKSPKAYLTDLRLEQAAFMLSGTKLAVTDIAASVGMNDPLYFSKVFNKRYGDSPVSYRSKHTLLPPASDSKGSF